MIADPARGGGNRASRFLSPGVMLTVLFAVVLAVCFVAVNYSNDSVAVLAESGTWWNNIIITSNDGTITIQGIDATDLLLCVERPSTVGSVPFDSRVMMVESITH